MPESRVRKKAAAKKRQKHGEELRAQHEAAAPAPGPGGGRWVAPTFIAVGLLGVIWLVVYYIAGAQVPGMKELGDWNILIGMGLMALSFLIATMWK